MNRDDCRFWLVWRKRNTVGVGRCYFWGRDWLWVQPWSENFLDIFFRWFDRNGTGSDHSFVLRKMSHKPLKLIHTDVKFNNTWQIVTISLCTWSECCSRLYSLTLLDSHSQPCHAQPQPRILLQGWIKSCCLAISQQTVSELQGLDWNLDMHFQTC